MIMAERQGVQGAIWNDRAVRLLELLGWDHIGDKNMDLKGIDEEFHGIDALACYESPGIDLKQSCLVESKKYAMGSLSATIVKGWIETLKQKIEVLSQSEDVLTEFPKLQDCCDIDLGIIMCWVHDVNDESFFEKDFEKYLSKAAILTLAKPLAYRRIVVLTNPKIIRLCSMATILQDNAYDYKFVYPSQLIKDKPLSRTKVLTIEYALSDFILAEREKKASKGEKECVIFYFGQIRQEAFMSMHEALTMFNFLEVDKNLIIYHYEDSDDSRIVMSDLEKYFSNVKVSFEPMTRFELSKEPAIIKTNSK